MRNPEEECPDDTACYACHAPLPTDAIEDSFCSLECAKGGVVKNIFDLARVVEADDTGTSEEAASRIARRLFKATRCGISFYVPDTWDRVVLSGYAEGTDAECPPHELRFPFRESKFWEAVEEADEEGCELFDLTHCSECGAEGLCPVEEAGLCADCVKKEER